MKMQLIPNPEKAGKYFCYITDCESPETLSSALQAERLNLTKIFVHFLCDTNPNDPVLLSISKKYSDAEIAQMTKDDIEKIQQQDVLIPKWVLSATNFPKVAVGNYYDIKPVTAEFVTTLNCNFRCNQCSYAEPKKNIGVWVEAQTNKHMFDLSNENHMTEYTMKASIDKLVEGGVRNILFTGGGEPFFNADITLKGIHYAKSKGLIIGIYSNGSLLNEDIVDQLYDAEPLFIRISIYGSTKESFTQYTNQNNRLFYRVFKNIKLLAQRKNIFNSSTQLGLSYLVHPDTMQEIADISKALQENFSINELHAINFIRFTPAVEYFGSQQHSQNLMEKFFLRIENEVKPTLSALGIDVKIYYHRLADLNSKKSYTTCRASGWYIEVGPNADVYLCCEKLFLPAYKIGNLLEQSLDEIFSCPKRKQVINRVNEALCYDCPTLCKPHELNKIFEEIENIRTNDDQLRLDEWKKELLRFGREQKHIPGRLNDFES